MGQDAGGVRALRKERERRMGDGLLGRRLRPLVPFAVLHDGFLGVFRRRFLRRYFCFLRCCGLDYLGARRVVVGGKPALAFPAAFLVFSAPTFLGMMLEEMNECLRMS